MVGGILLLISWAPAEAQQAEQQRDDTAGAVWRLVRGGGGLVSPWGTTGVSLQSVTSSGERFVAVGEWRLIAHSSDGNRWELATDHDYLADKHFEAVAWNGERFVAVSYFDGTIMHSTDGDRWERARETATRDLLRDVAWGNGRFVAVGWNGTIVISP